MSRGLGRVEREIVSALESQREPLLADRWHALLVNTDRESDRLLEASDAVWKEAPGSPLNDIKLSALRLAGAVGKLEIPAPGPHLGPPLSHIGLMVRSSKNPYSAEVSTQRAAKRLSQKGLVEREYIDTPCWTTDPTRKQRRSIVCVRIPPTADELSDAAMLRAEAGRIYTRHVVAAVAAIMGSRTEREAEATAREWLDFADRFRPQRPVRYRQTLESRLDKRWLDRFVRL